MLSVKFKIIILSEFLILMIFILGIFMLINDLQWGNCGSNDGDKFGDGGLC